MCADRQEVETPETTYREGRAMNQLAKQTLADLRPNAERLAKILGINVWGCRRIPAANE
jgi:hypothetical protein